MVPERLRMPAVFALVAAALDELPLVRAGLDASGADKPSDQDDVCEQYDALVSPSRRIVQAERSNLAFGMSV